MTNLTHRKKWEMCYMLMGERLFVFIFVGRSDRRLGKWENYDCSMGWIGYRFEWIMSHSSRGEHDFDFFFLSFFCFLMTLWLFFSKETVVCLCVSTMCHHWWTNEKIAFVLWWLRGNALPILLQWLGFIGGETRTRFPSEDSWSFSFA